MARRFAKVSEEEIEEAFFYPSDLVNTKTTIPLRVGEERWIYTSTLRVSVYIHHYSPPLRGIVVYYTFSINLLLVYRESVNLIGYITRRLSADSQQPIKIVLLFILTNHEALNFKLCITNFLIVYHEASVHIARCV